jgi:hypothetical protein
LATTWSFHGNAYGPAVEVLSKLLSAGEKTLGPMHLDTPSGLAISARGGGAENDAYNRERASSEKEWASVSERIEEFLHFSIP